MDKSFSPFTIEESKIIFGLAGYSIENAVEVQRGDSWLSKMKLILSLKTASLKYPNDAWCLNQVASIIFSQMPKKNK
ncbi:MAG: hypothetical protein HOA85_00310 [Candidatus Pacebacteria bacterium]|jgi:hypothetical protein|nr:hypothetical protein [Candidatus Paceibacterota bacterium]MBT6755705.1 hypothetical protein [Candidatus Paceibacterota bacterium]